MAEKTCPKQCSYSEAGHCGRLGNDVLDGERHVVGDVAVQRAALTKCLSASVISGGTIAEPDHAIGYGSTVR